MANYQAALSMTCRVKNNQTNEKVTLAWLVWSSFVVSLPSSLELSPGGSDAGGGGDGKSGLLGGP